MCPTCSTKNRKQTVNSRSSPKQPSESKKLRKIRIVGGNDNQEVIMVSASDYENLIALGSYEPVEETYEKPVVMKEVYGKQKSPYKHVSSDRQTHGPRHRVVLDHQTKSSENESNEEELWGREFEKNSPEIDESELESESETGTEIESDSESDSDSDSELESDSVIDAGEDELLNSLNDLSDIDQYIPKEKQQGNEGERQQLKEESEEGWSI